MPSLACLVISVYLGMSRLTTIATNRKLRQIDIAVTNASPSNEFLKELSMMRPSWHRRDQCHKNQQGINIK